MSDRAILFDFDGTLADSLGILKQAYFEWLSLYGQRGTDDEFRDLNGPPLKIVLQTLKERYSLGPDLVALTRSYLDIVDALYGKVAAMPGAGEILERAHGLGWSLWIVTSNQEALVRRWLEEKRLLSYFRGIVGEGSTPRGKPAPDPYLEAVRRSGLAASCAVAAEDSVLGVSSALGAGLKTYFMDSGFSGKLPPAFENHPELVQVPDLPAMMRLVFDTKEIEA